MTVQGNGNMLIAKAYGLIDSSTPSSAIRPSYDLDCIQFQKYLVSASSEELEEDLLFPSTWEILK